VSDRASRGEYEDLCGPMIQKIFEEDVVEFPFQLKVHEISVVPDEIIPIQSKIKEWSHPLFSPPIALILTTGGTGFSPRDITPEAITPLLHRQAQSLSLALLNEGLRHTPLAVLSRPVCGTIHSSLICTLPGSTKAVKENAQALIPLLPRIIKLMQTGDCDH